MNTQKLHFQSARRLWILLFAALLFAGTFGAGPLLSIPAMAQTGVQGGTITTAPMGDNCTKTTFNMSDGTRIDVITAKDGSTKTTTTTPNGNSVTVTTDGNGNITKPKP